MNTLKILLFIWTMAYLLSMPGLWMLFRKLEIIPWYSLIPVFNLIVLMEYFEVNLWYLLLMSIQPAGVALLFYINYKLAKSFGEGIGIAIGLTIWFTKPIFITILGFGNYEFIGKEGIV